MSLEDAFYIDLEPKMFSKRGPWEVFFSEAHISWFLKDVLNKMLTFEAEMEPKIDAKTKKRSWKIEVAAKTTKMLQNGWQKGSRKHPKSTKKRYKKRIENGGRFFAPKGVLLSFEAEKV